MMRAAMLWSLLASCAAPPYACQESSQCVRGATAGICSSARCAFSSSSCASGYRYDSSAGDLAGRCVGGGTTSGGTSGGSGLHCDASEGSCTCSAGDANGVPCSQTSLPNSACCADSGFPADGTACTCNAISCFKLSDGSCECAIGLEQPAGSTRVSNCLSTSTMQCCQDYYLPSGDPDPTQPCNCRVGNNPCANGGQAHNQCQTTPYDYGLCPSGTTKVAACAT